jgi:hypothetical protein
MTIGEQVLRSAVAAVVTDREGHGSVPTPPSRVGVRLIWCAIHPRCSEEFTAYYTQATQFLHLARWTRLVRSFPDWTRYSTGQATDRRTPLRVLAEHVRDHGPVPTVTVTARPQEEGRLPQWTAACGQIRPGELPGTLVHVVLQPSGPPRTTFQEALMDCQDLARETGAVRMRPNQASSRRKTPPASSPPSDTPWQKRPPECRAVSPGGTPGLRHGRLQGHPAGRRTGRQGPRQAGKAPGRPVPAQAQAVRRGPHGRLRPEIGHLLGGLGPVGPVHRAPQETRSLTRTLREVFDRTAAVGFVLENMARTT